MTGSPAVSVLLPVYNASAWLERGLQSMFRQRGVDLEILAVDDGSTDTSVSLLRDLARRDARLVVVESEHCGIVAALNRGLEQCRAPLIARMDADDVSHPWRLFHQVTCLQERPELGAVSCLVRKFPRQRVLGGMLRYEAWLNSLVTEEHIARDIYVESPLAHPSVVVRRHVLLEAGGYREVPWPEDYDLWLRLHQQGVRFAKVPLALFFWAEHQGQLTRTSGRCSEEAIRRCKVDFLRRGPLCNRSKVVVWGAGPTGKPFARELQAQGLEVVAFVELNPRKIGQRIYGSPVIAPPGVADLPGVPILVAVGREGAREEARARCAALGLKEGLDFWCVA